MSEKPSFRTLENGGTLTDQSCDCIETMQAMLEPENARLALTIQWTSGRAFPTIQTEKIAPRGKKLPIVVPSYCPFCGVKYAEVSGQKDDATT